MSKHTPGPWTVEIQDGLFPSVRIGKSVPYADNSGFYDGRVCINACSPGADLPVHDANATLIAAAPDLLEALRWCKSLILTHGDSEAISKLYAALAKADAV